MKPTIIAIVGDSGSGKTHLSKLLQNELNVFQIISHTTRSKRETEQEGTDYYFVRQRHVPASEILTFSQFGKYDYYALIDQVPPRGFCTYVVDENGAKALKRKYDKKYHVVFICIQSTPLTLDARGICASRIERDSNREQLPNSFYDYIISNDGSLEEFENQIHETFKLIKVCQGQK